MNSVVEIKQGALAQTQNTGRMAVSEIIAHVTMVQEVMRAVMKKDVHYGIIPGTDKPTLLKPGAEVLCMAFRIADSYSVEDLSADGSVRYRVTCTGTHQTSGTLLGTGMGEASSGEEKYKWRKAFEAEFNTTPENLRRKKSGFNKKENRTFETFQVRTESADLANTILKMANKRAKMAMVLNVTAASDCFAQDLEDMDEALRDHLTRHENDAPPPEKQMPAYPADKFATNLPAWRKAIAGGKATVDGIVAKLRTVGTLTPAQVAAISEPLDLTGHEDHIAHNEPPSFSGAPTYAQVASSMVKAANADALDDAASLIGEVANAEHRAELSAKYEARKAELEGAAA